MCRVQGLATAWRKREAAHAKRHPAKSGLQQGLRRLRAPRRGDVYCMLTCEGQVCPARV